MLAKHLGDIPASARELNVSTPDLRRLTWARPNLLEEAELERMGIIGRAQGVVIEAIYSDDPRRQMWGAERLMSSWLRAIILSLRRGVGARRVRVRAKPALSPFAGPTVRARAPADHVASYPAAAK